MENIARRVQAGELACEIGLIVSDQPGALALEKARRLNLRTWVVNRGDFASRAEFETRISDKLEEVKIDLIVLAGFMRILGPEFVKRWKWRILNIHPSLLPKHPGAHAIRDVFEARDPVTGVTVHFVDEGVDSGPVIRQAQVPVLPADTLAALEARVHAAEYRLYPEVIGLWLAGKIQIAGSKVRIV